jgi:hypothetical protein
MPIAKTALIVAIVIQYRLFIVYVLVPAVLGYE